MNAAKSMKIIAILQLIPASASSIVFIPLTIWGWFSIFPIFICILGIILLIGYFRVALGKLEISKTRGFWITSLAFNATGFFCLIIFLFYLIKTHDGGMTLEINPWFWLPVTSSVIGVILATSALFILSEKTSEANIRLEN
jgi:hypothetical protein